MGIFGRVHLKSLNLCITFQNDDILEDNLVLAVGSGQMGLVVVGLLGLLGWLVWSGCSGTIFLSILSVTDKNDRTRDDGTL